MKFVVKSEGGGDLGQLDIGFNPQLRCNHLQLAGCLIFGERQPGGADHGAVDGSRYTARGLGKSLRYLLRRAVDQDPHPLWPKLPRSTVRSLLEK